MAARIVEIMRIKLREAGSQIDFDDVTDKVIAALTSDAEIDEALRFLVRGYVSSLVVRDRHDTQRLVQAEIAEGRLATCANEPGPQRGRFIPVWQRMLDEIISREELGPPKRFGDLSDRDIALIIATDEKRVAMQVADIRWHRSIHEAMLQTKAPLVRKLPPAILEAVHNARRGRK